MFSLVTSMKVFSDRWVGSPTLNRYGLHRKRLKTARAITKLRRLQTVRLQSAAERELLEQGCVAIENFLSDAEFAALHSEVTAAVDAAAAVTPLPEKPEVWGFGNTDRHQWGFDRFDGSTLNRFVDPGERARAFAARRELKRLSRVVTGRKHHAGRVYIYQTVNGDDAEIPDLQRDFHRDTFFNALKYWLFLDPVRAEDGPMTYVPTSHRLTPERIAWEEAKAAAAVQARIEGNRAGMSGSFRIAEEEIAGLGLPAPKSFTVPANTLVVANVFGFHRRGDAEPGTRRLALYGNHRPQPFLLVGS